jgi:DNA-binding MarR family transcriptional regulator
VADGEQPGVALARVMPLLRGSARSGQLLMANIAKARSLWLADFNALARIVDSGGVSPGVLAQSLPLDQSTMTELADRLERAGLIKRSRGLEDRRRVLLRATKRGERIVRQSFAPVFAAVAEILEATPAEDQEAVIRFLSALDDAFADLAGMPEDVRDARN